MLLTEAIHLDTFSIFMTCRLDEELNSMCEDEEPKLDISAEVEQLNVLICVSLFPDASIVLTEDTDSFIIGDRVWVGGTKPGQIAYIGETQFAPGEWAGVVLDETVGQFLKVSDEYIIF
jgi:hypothetical protein